MKALIIADIHGKFGTLQNIIDAAVKEGFDFILAPGDFTDMFDIPPNFSQLDVADIVVQKLLIPNKPLFCVPGNHDPYEILEIFDEYGISCHNKLVRFRGIGIAGWGGAATPFNTLLEPTEEETAEALGKLLKDYVGNLILMTHAPPKGTTLDELKSKEHVGSAAVRDIILKKKPVLAVTAHIHENSGSDMLGGSAVFYPGPAYDGHYGFATIEAGKVACVSRKAATA